MGTRESRRSTGTRRNWRRSWTSCCRCGFLSLLSTHSQMLSTPVQSQIRGLAHLKLDQVKRRKGARGKENAKRRRNTWIVTTRAISTVMLQELSIYKAATDWGGQGFLDHFDSTPLDSDEDKQGSKQGSWKIWWSPTRSWETWCHVNLSSKRNLSVQKTTP